MRALLSAGLPLLVASTVWLGAQDSRIGGFTAASSVRQSQLEERLKTLPSAENCRRYHAVLTEDPHVAGTPGGRKVADYILRQFREAGLNAEQVQYDVLLSYPRKVELELTVPEKIRLANREQGIEGDKDSFDTRVDPPWHAYSQSGHFEGQVVYANYGRAEDYDALEKMGISVQGRIVLARYFKGYRGGKSLEAEKRGVQALILFSDPADDGYAQGEAYPRGPWGPPSHVQRGANVYDFLVPGDPLTPGWASTADARRISPEESEILPKMASLPISYADAQHILRNLAGPAVPSGWQGGLPFAYHTGPGPAQVRLDLDISRERRPIFDVIARIEGSQEPERLVILSNHHDAWVYGAVDPSSGTATLIELAHVLGRMANDGWRPRRTLILAAWDSEEYTLTGSTEWGEEHADELRRNAVACLNVDASVSGPTFSASAVPSLRGLIVAVTRSISDPGGGTVFEKWAAGNYRSARGYAVSGAGELPVDIGILGSGSDYTVFFNFLGVPSVDMLFDGPYGVYHSQYDDHAWMSRFGDPGFYYHRTMATLWGIMALRLANADIVPFDYTAYGRDLKGYAQDLGRAAGRRLDTTALFSSIERFTNVAARVRAAADALLEGDFDPDKAARINRAFLKVERDLTVPEGIPGRPWFKHLIYAPLPSYQAETLPGVREAAQQGDLERARQQLEALVAAIVRATATLSGAL